MARKTERSGRSPLEAVREQLTVLQNEAQWLVGRLRTEAETIIDGRAPVQALIEEARRLQSEASAIAGHAIRDLDARRAMAIEAVATQLSNLTTLALKRLRLVRYDEVADLAERVATVEAALAALRDETEAA